MKRNKTTNKVKQNKTTTKTKGPSKYALKVRSKKQMYGPGCCAHDRIKK